MRLICPNCDAQYEVPDNVIPENGRDVQCSDCGHTWFQDAEGAAAQAAPERKPVPPEVAEILKDEAERERRVRQEERQAAELQDDDTEEDNAEAEEDTPEPEAPSHPFVDPNPNDEPEETEAERRSREARDRMSRMRSYNIEEKHDAEAAASSSRRDLLPDIEAINNTLVPEPAPKRHKASEYDMAHLQARETRAAGFRSGMTVAIVAGIGIAGLYFLAGELSRAVPALEPYLSSYVASIDYARLWVDAKAQGLLMQIDQFSGGDA